MEDKPVRCVLLNLFLKYSPNTLEQLVRRIVDNNDESLAKEVVKPIEDIPNMHVGDELGILVAYSEKGWLIGYAEMQSEVDTHSGAYGSPPVEFKVVAVLSHNIVFGLIINEESLKHSDK